MVAASFWGAARDEGLDFDRLLEPLDLENVQVHYPVCA